MKNMKGDVVHENFVDEFNQKVCKSLHMWIISN
jgi:hypothetical protein